MFSSSGGGDVSASTTASVEPPAAKVSAEPRTATVATTAATTRGASKMEMASMAAAARADSVRSASAIVTPPSRMIQAERRAPESAAIPSLPKAPVVAFHPRTVNIASVGAMNVDSIVRSSTKRGRESYTDKVGTGVGVPVSVNSGELLTSSPTIIGRAPLPRFPDALRSVQPEGEVIVRFKVDERGRVDVGSMAVVRSDHELFTDAVRDILPNYRFEPARTPAPESKAVAVWVNLPFKFTAKN
jgi:TonB family protein